jgi:hypothetical protein
MTTLVGLGAPAFSTEGGVTAGVTELTAGVAMTQSPEKVTLFVRMRLLVTLSGGPQGEFRAS